jgi:hypothetical protein
MQRGLLAAETIIKLSRLDREAATEILRAEVIEWEPAEAAREIEEAAAALERAREKGLVPPKALSASSVKVTDMREHAGSYQADDE